jgi:hypothetical protein
MQGKRRIGLRKRFPILWLRLERIFRCLLSTLINMMHSLPIKSGLVTLLIMASAVGFSQSSKTPLDKGFIDKTIAYYYGRQVKLHPGNTFFLIEKDSFNMSAKTDYGTFKVQFVSEDKLAEQLIKAIKKTAQLDRILIKWISLDTIDVAITRCTIEVKSGSKVVDGQKVTTTEHSISNCSEANVEIPTCRFVYYQPTSAWSQLDDGRLVKKN